MRILTLLFLFFSVSAPAEWLCDETSSKSQGDAILACGIGEGKTIQKARDRSRSAAFSEFEQLCQRSSACQPFEVEVEPRRTECRKAAAGFRCTRGVLFRITSKRKKDTYVNVEDVQKAINKERVRLKRLQETYETLLQLRISQEASKKQIASLKKVEATLDATESKQTRLEMKIAPEAVKKNEYKYAHLIFDHSIHIDVSFNGLTLEERVEGQVELAVGYQYRLLPWLAVGARYAYGGNLLQDAIRSQSDRPTTGTPNTSAESIGELGYHDFSGSVTYYPGFWMLFLKASIGASVGSFEIYTTTFGPLGTATQTSVLERDVSQEYVDISIGVDSRDDRKGGGFFLGIGARQRFAGGSPSISILSGFNFGF